VLPGFGLALGYTLVYLSIADPAAAGRHGAQGIRTGLHGQIMDIALGERSLAAFRVTFGASLIGCCGQRLFWPDCRVDTGALSFPGKRFVDALVDLPFALADCCGRHYAGHALCGNGWLGQYIEPLGFKIAYTPSGIVVALIFITLPFVVRTLQPVIEDIEMEVEEAAATLGASRWQTFP
jgi:sulfate transport system permease protein